MAGALIVLLELLNRSIRRPVELTNRLGISPIAAIPYIRTRNELIKKRIVLIAMLALFVAGVPALLYLIHIEYMPLDLLLKRGLGKLGF